MIINGFKNEKTMLLSHIKDEEDSHNTCLKEVIITNEAIKLLQDEVKGLKDQNYEKN